jgi:hypothetical protein
MLNFVLDYLPVFINVDAQYSSACENVILSPLTTTAIIKWRSGSISSHYCRRRDMLRLLFTDCSIGQWANRYCLNQA